MRWNTSDSGCGFDRLVADTPGSARNVINGCAVTSRGGLLSLVSGQEGYRERAWLILSGGVSTAVSRDGCPSKPLAPDDADSPQQTALGLPIPCRRTSSGQAVRPWRPSPPSRSYLSKDCSWRIVVDAATRLGVADRKGGPGDTLRPRFR